MNHFLELSVLHQDASVRVPRRPTRWASASEAYTSRQARGSLSATTARGTPPRCAPGSLKKAGRRPARVLPEGKDARMGGRVGERGHQAVDLALVTQARRNLERRLSPVELQDIPGALFA